jgi:hypothetical protein
MFFSKGPRHKKSARGIRVRYRLELLELENRVVPSTAGLDAFLHPSAPAASVVAATAVSAAAPASDVGIGDQVSAKAQALQDTRTTDGAQGIGADLSAFVQTLVPPTTGDEGNSGHQPPTSGGDSDQPSGDQGIGDQVSAKAHELQDARTSGDSRGIGADLSAFVHTLVPSTGDEGDSDQAAAHSAVFASDSSADAFGTWPAAADGVANTFSNAAAHSPLFDSDSSADGSPALPAAADDGIATAAGENSSSQAPDHSPVFETDQLASDASLADSSDGDAA